MELAEEKAERRSGRISSPLSDVKRLTSEEQARVQMLAGADEWFLEGDSAPIGPLGIEQMKERWLAHQLGPESRCWGIGLAGWTPLARVGALTRALGPRPLPPVLKPPEGPQPPTRAPEPVAPPPAPLKAPPLSPHRRSKPLAYEVGDVATGSAWRALRSVVGAVVGLCAAAALIALIAGPPLLSPPAPHPVATPPPPAPPRPAPPAPRRQAPERRVAKKPALAPEENPQPAPSAPPDVEAAFDREFGPPSDGPKAAAQPRSVYIPPAPPRPSRPKARLGAADVMAVVVAHKAQLVKCRQAALAQDPGLSGKKLLMQWTVSPEGIPLDVEPLPSDLQDSDLAACVTRAIWNWKFPEHTAEQPPITFPFVF